MGTRGRFDMRKLGIVVALGVLSAASSASAADLPPAGPPLYSAPPPTWTWNGCYVGGQVGYGFASDTDNETVTASGAASPFSPGSAASPNGFLGGGYVGCNWQPLGPPIVFGVEADAEWANLTGTTSFTGTGMPPDTFQSQINGQGAICGRIGYAFNRVLLYAAGGVAFANINEHDVLAAAGASDDNSTTATGWTLGLGMDYALSPNWIARVEYRYSNFGSFAYDPVVFPAFTENHAITENAVIAGVAYKFW